MDRHFSTLEADVAETRARLEAMQTNDATCVAFLAAEGRLELKIESSKNELARQSESMRNELNLKVDMTEQRLSHQIEASRWDAERNFAQMGWELNRRIIQTNSGLGATMYRLVRP